MQLLHSGAGITCSSPTSLAEPPPLVGVLWGELVGVAAGLLPSSPLASW